MIFEDIFDSAEQAASSAIKINDGDYFNEDGLLMCGKCNTPKQTRVELFGRIKTPMCICECENAKLKAEEKQRNFSKRVEKLREIGLTDSKMLNWRFEHEDGENKELSALARKYVEHFPEMKDRGKGLLLFGSVGTGKTYIAVCIANELIDRGYPCLVTSFARLVNKIGGLYTDKQEFIDGLNRFDLLVIDDLAAERDTEFMGEIVQNIIDSRYRSGKPLIVTTNLTSDELQNPADIRKQRTYSRLYEMCIPFCVKGNDRRQKKLRSDYAEVKTLLGL